MGFRRGFKAQANRIAVRVRESLGLNVTDPINPELVCCHYDIELIKLSSLGIDCHMLLTSGSSDFSAVTVPRGIDTAIVHNDSHNKFRQHSNICHELAHCFLGHEYAPPLTGDGELNTNGGIEDEAAFLSGCLLITNEAANHILYNGLYDQAQQIYGVSQRMLDYRLRVSGAHSRHQRRFK
jgi:Zn-dependent peptidase ImmA (M78 family)